MNGDLLTEWKQRLGMNDWVIVLKDNAAPDDMPLNDCMGCAEWTESNKTATVWILDPKYYSDDRITPFDYEKTLVHELLHLKLCLVSDDVSDLQARYMHQIIDDLARALVDAKRNVSSPDRSHKKLPTTPEDIIPGASFF